MHEHHFSDNGQLKYNCTQVITCRQYSQLNCTGLNRVRFPYTAGLNFFYACTILQLQVKVQR